MAKTIYRVNSREEKLLQTALILAIVTIIYNVAEGIISVFFGIADETLALLGFGVDSFVEVLSGAGILHMIARMKRAGISDVSSRDRFEKRALKITGTAFYILVGGLLVGSVINILRGTKPETTVAGIIIAGLSILTMYVLMTWKYRIGRKLNSEAIIADAGCTKTCFYLSIILLASSALYELVGIGWVDIAGSLGIAWFAFTEGKEAFEKSNLDQLSCADCP
jgi:divalent metal cation (Fe/Co/Zn/Cd) transporter